MFPLFCRAKDTTSLRWWLRELMQKKRHAERVSA